MPTTVVARVFPIVVNVALMSVCLFGAVGHLHWWHAWTLVGLSFLATVAGSVVVWRNPALLAERRTFKRGEAWDKRLVGLTVLLGPIVTWITAGLDVRQHGTAQVPVAAGVVGVGAAIVGSAVIIWAMSTNPFFSAVARVQTDRGHTVITSGPYHFVRHPGYAGMLLFLLGTPLILGSWYAYGPAIATAALMVLRTVLEDRMLQRRLTGYTEYTQDVRTRLVPFVW